MAVWIRWGVHETLNSETKQFLRMLSKVSAAKAEDVFVTSANDGIHSPASFHYTNDAFDHFKGKIIESHYKPAELDELRDRNPIFDILDESNHIHVEFDPK